MCVGKLLAGITFAIAIGLFNFAAAQEPTVNDLSAQAFSVLKKHCFTCHNAEESRGDLDVTSVDKLMAGSASGPVLIPGRPQDSPLYLLAAHQGEPKMPPNAPRLSQRELGILARWIASIGDNLPRPDRTSRKTPGEMGDDTAAGSDRGASESRPGLVPVRPVAGKMPVLSVAASPELGIAAVPGQRQVLLYDYRQDRWVGGLDYPEGDIFVLRFSADGKRLAAGGGVGGRSGAVVVWDLQSYDRIATIPVGRDVVLALDLSPDGTHVAIGGPSRLTSVLRVTDGATVYEFTKHADWVTSVSFSGDGVLLASGDRFGTLCLWELATGDEYLTRRSHQGMISALAWSADSNHLVSAGRDGLLSRLDVASGLAESAEGHAGGVEALLAVGERWFTVGGDRRLVARDANLRPEQVQDFDFSPIGLAACGLKGGLFVAGDDGDIRHVESIGTGTVRRCELPRTSHHFAVKSARPRPVDREFIPPISDASDRSSAYQPDTDDSSSDELVTLRQIIASTEESLMETRESVKSLERTLDELKGLLKSREASSKGR